MTAGADEPLDLRLVPAAAAVWGVAAFAVVLSESAARVSGVLLCVVAVAVGVFARHGPTVVRRGSSVATGAPQTAARGRPVGIRGHSKVEVGTAAVGQAVLVFGAVGALLVATSGQIRAREDGDIRRLAEDGATVRIAGLVRSTPVPVARGPGRAGEGADSEGADTEGADTERADTERADAEGADTERADTERADAEGADTERADTERADAEGADTEGAGSERPNSERPNSEHAPASGVVRFLLAARSIEVPGPVTVRPSGAAVEVLAPASAAELAYGTQIEVVARLSPVQDRARRPVVRARAVDDPMIRAGPPRLLDVTESLRTGLARTASVVPGDAGRLLPAVAVGDMRSVGDLEEAMRASGLAHLTAVSGAHFSLVGGVVLALAARCRVPRRWRWIAVAGVMVGFVALVHPGASVVRAAVMGAVGVLGLVAGRPARSVPALAGAVLVLLVVDPWLARDLGFVLSVVATAGIALLAGPLAGLLREPLAALGRVHRTRSVRAEPAPASALALALAVPVAAQAVCAPVVLLLAPTIPTYAVLANVLVAPAVAPATVGGLLAALLGPWWAAGAAWCAQVAGAACWWIAAVARTASGLPGGQIAWAGGALGPVLLACASGAALVLVLRCRRGVAP